MLGYMDGMEWNGMDGYGRGSKRKKRAWFMRG